MRGERLQIYWSLLLNKSKRIVTIVQTEKMKRGGCTENYPASRGYIFVV